MNRPARLFGRARGARRTTRLTFGPARRAALAALALGALGFAAGCSHSEVQRPMQSPYGNVPHPVDLAPFLAGSLYDRTLLDNNTPFNVSGFSLVGQLRGTGSCVAPPLVRAYMIKQLNAHGFGDALVPGFEHVSAGQVLADPNYAVVRVDGFIPPGARKGDWFDVRVTALPGNPTRSLAHGVLFETDLKIAGADPENPTGPVNIFARCKGPVLVNPSYALGDATSPTGAARASLRTGVVMYSGLVMQDRPIFLRLRDPQRSTARRIEERVWKSFDFATASAQDEGIVQLFVPPAYRGDWEHFTGVVQHMFLDTSPQFNAAKSKELVAEARKPDALLEEISLCWEGIGKDALPFILPLLTDARPEVAFAAARAAVFIGDNTGASEQRLVQMALTAGHPFRLNAVQTLGALPASSALNHSIRGLLDAEEATVRIEAYRILARNGDHSVFSRIIAPANDPTNQKFVLDLVDCDAPPVIYASRQGAPRIAVIGRRPDVRLPVMFSALDNRLTISSYGNERNLTLFFRDPIRRDPVKVLSLPDVAELIARLGGDGARDEDHMNFAYGEVLAIVQSLAQMGQLAATDDSGHLWNTAFVLQDLPRLRDVVREAPTVPGGAPARPGQPDLGTPAGGSVGQVGETGLPAGGATAHGPLFSGR